MVAKVLAQTTGNTCVNACVSSSLNLVMVILMYGVDLPQNLMDHHTILIFVFMLMTAYVLT